MLQFTGALESPQDSRDLPLGKVQAPVAVPTEFLPDYSALPIYYQNGVPACGGHAGAWLANGFQFIEDGKVVKLSPRFVYALCKKIDGIPATDGTYMRAIFKVLREYGVCEDKYFPNDITLPVAEYADWTLIPPEAYENAKKYKIKSYAFVDDKSKQGLKQAIYQNKFVLILKKPWIPTNPSGHFFVANGYKTNIRYANSFGTTWGENGYGWLTDEDIPKVIEAGTAVDLEPEDLAELIRKRDLLTYIRDLYRKVLWLKGLKPVV